MGVSLASSLEWKLCPALDIVTPTGIGAETDNSDHVHVNSWVGLQTGSYDGLYSSKTSEL